MIAVGDEAPDFTLEGAQGTTVREFTLSEVATDRPVVLVFYIYDYSPVCTTQMCEVNDMELMTFNDTVAVLGVSTDGPYSHMEFIADNQLSYPLLTDDDKRVYDQYGLCERTEEGRLATKRGIVVVDPDLTVRYTWQADDNWDSWQTRPLTEVDEITRELIG